MTNKNPFQQALIVSYLFLSSVSISQVGINTTNPTKKLDINVENATSDGINISHENFEAQFLLEPIDGGTLAINNSEINGTTSIRFNNSNRMTFTQNGFFPGMNATDNTVSGAVDIGRFDLHFRRTYTRAIHVNDNAVNGGLRINIGSMGGATSDYNFSDFAFYPVESQRKDLGRNGNFWRNFYFVSAFTPSDKRLKRNIKTLSHGTEALLKLGVYEYNYTFEDTNKIHYGFMAQEVQKVLPELVAVGDDEDKSLSINYTETIPIIIKALQEQQAVIETQSKEIKELRSAVSKLLEK